MTVLGSTLDPSTLPVVNPAAFLPVPQAIDPLDYQALFQAWLTEFVALWPEYDVGELQTDPAAIVAQAMSFVRLLDRAHVNDAYAALRLAMATGANLAGLAADRGVKPLVYVPATATTAAVTEPDDSLRLRTWLKMQTWGSGSPYGVEYHARTLGLGSLADCNVIDFPGEGRMTAVLLPIAGLSAADAEALRATVGNGLMARTRRPGSVWIDTVLADIVTVNYSGVIGIRRGASAAALQAGAVAGLTSFMTSRRRVGAVVPIDGITAAQRTSNVVWVHPTSPTADIVVADTAAAELGTVAITTQVVDD